MNRIISLFLTLLLLGLLGWCIHAEVGDVAVRVTLGMGACLGLLYCVNGKLPDWIVDHSDGLISDDSDPSNIPPSVYLPILLGVVLIAVAMFVVTMKLL